jgi:hypothetical protein
MSGARRGGRARPLNAAAPARSRALGGRDCLPAPARVRGALPRGDADPGRGLYRRLALWGAGLAHPAPVQAAPDPLPGPQDFGRPVGDEGVDRRDPGSRASGRRRPRRHDAGRDPGTDSTGVSLGVDVFDGPRTAGGASRNQPRTAAADRKRLEAHDSAPPAGRASAVSAACASIDLRDGSIARAHARYLPEGDAGLTSVSISSGFIRELLPGRKGPAPCPFMVDGF